MKLILVVFAALFVSTLSQDSFGGPDSLLADINPGPNSSSPQYWYYIDSVGKAYSIVTVTGKKKILYD